MTPKEDAFKEFKGYEKLRNEFFEYLDSKIPLIEGTLNYDFEKCPTLDAKEVYERFFKLDYQARKVRGVGIALLEERDS